MKACIKTLTILLFCVLINHTIVEAQVWEPLDGGLPATPTAITSSGNLLAVAYTLGIEKEHRLHQVSIWNGVYWSKLPRIYSDSNSLINALLFKDSGLYIAGKFHTFNNLNDVRNLIFWKEKKYNVITELSSTSTANSEYINHLSSLGDKLVVAGSFKNELLTGGNNLAFYEDGKWVTSGITSLISINGPVNTAIWVNKNFVIGGRFTKIGSRETNYIGGFRASQSFEKIKNEFIPQKMVALDTNIVYWGLHATDKSTMPSFFLYNSDTLEELNNGLDKVNEVYDIVSDGHNVYAVGVFKLDGSDIKQNIIRLVEGKWRAMPGGIFPGLKKVEIFRGSIIAAGSFKSYRNITLLNIARFIPNQGAVIGRVYFDKDQNCVFNFRDEALGDRLVHITPGDFYIRPNDDGRYLVFLKEGKYTFTVLPRKYWKASSCDVLSKTVVVEDGEVSDTADFALVQEASVRDLSVKLNSQTGGLATRKNVQLYYINYENLGSNEVNNAVITLHFDDQLEKLEASPAPTSVKGDSAIWNMSLIPGTANVIKCRFNIASTAGAELNLLATIAQDKAEEDDIENNSSSLQQKIQEEDIEIGKQVNPGVVSGDTAYIEPGTSKVDYQISFSNYTDDTVRTVYVVDTIGLNHSMQEIRETGASHPYTYEIIPGKPGENIATIIWTFNGINLAPNPLKLGEVVNDDGFIGFSIGLKSNLEEGTMLTNKAQVAFDYSDEKPTNSVYAVVMEPSAIWTPKMSNQDIRVFPNPATNKLHIATDQVQDFTYKIYSFNGSLISLGRGNSNTEISILNLSSGMYLLRLESEEFSYQSRFIKQ